MKRIDRYIFRELLGATLFVAVTLTGVVWLTQSLRFVEMIVNRGLSVPLFLYFTMLLLPSFLGVILPIALFVAVLFVYNRMLSDSEIVVMRAGGCSHLALGRPAIMLALLTTVVCYVFTLYCIPASYREFKDLQHMLRNSYPTVLLQEGVFSNVMEGVTVYVRSRSDDGELFGLIVHDARNRNNPVTMMAERGAIVSGTNGPRIVLVNGNRQEVDQGDGRLSLLYFDRYSFDLSAIGTEEGERWRDPRERFLDELFFPREQEKSVGYFHKLRMEGHHRLTMPLLPLTLTMIALACLLGGEFNRRGLLWRIITAIVLTIAIEVAHLGIKNLGERAPEITFLMYLVPIVPGAAAIWLLNPRNGARLSRLRQAMSSPG